MSSMPCLCTDSQWGAFCAFGYLWWLRVRAARAGPVLLCLRIACSTVQAPVCKSLAPF